MHCGPDGPVVIAPIGFPHGRRLIVDFKAIHRNGHGAVTADQMGDVGIDRRVVDDVQVTDQQDRRQIVGLGIRHRFPANCHQVFFVA